MNTIGEKFDRWRALHKGSLDSLYDAFAAGHVEGDQTAKKRGDLARLIAAANRTLDLSRYYVHPSITLPLREVLDEIQKQADDR